MLIPTLYPCLGRLPFLLAEDPQAVTGGLVLVLPAAFVHQLGLFLRLSPLFFKTWLVEVGVYELGLGLWAPAVGTALLWYLFQLGQGARLLLLCPPARSRCSTSLDQLFRNARWLEREAGEMHGWFFAGKRDRRSLFLSPLLYWAPLRKAFPTSGFFEARLCTHAARISFFHISWND